MGGKTQTAWECMHEAASLCRETIASLGSVAGTSTCDQLLGFELLDRRECLRESLRQMMRPVALPREDGYGATRPLRQVAASVGHDIGLATDDFERLLVATSDDGRLPNHLKERLGMEVVCRLDRMECLLLEAIIFD